MVGLELDDHTATAIAIDPDGRVVAREQRTAADQLGDAALDAVSTIVGARAAGTVLVGITAFTPESPAYANVIKIVSKRFAGPFLQGGIVPSGTAAAVAEAWVGAAAGVDHVVYFSAEDHMIAGLVSRGQPWVGAHGRAGAVAWLALNPVEREDYRKHGCLEAEAAAHGIVRRLVWRIKAGDKSRVLDVANGELNAINVAMVLDAARAHDGVSISVMRDTAKYLGMAAANLVAAADPEVLVLGGIMATAADLLVEPVRTEIARRLSPATFASLRIVTATLGRDAAAIGAARLAGAAVR